MTHPEQEAPAVRPRRLTSPEDVLVTRLYQAWRTTEERVARVEAENRWLRGLLDARAA